MLTVQSISPKSIAYVYVLLNECSKVYPFPPLVLKQRLKERLGLESIKDINESQLQEAITLITDAINLKTN